LHAPSDRRETDTIAALATPPGRGAVAIIRVSGPAALPIAQRLTGLRPRPRRAALCTVRGGTGEPLDQGLLLYFPAPHSYTGEDVIEIQGHGGPLVSDQVLAAAFALGARPAQAGEFTLRAFLNDKLDLTQAEAIADLIDSGSQQAALAAMRSLSGEFSSRVGTLQARLTQVRMQLEAWLDFPDEELEREAIASLGESAGDALVALRSLKLAAGQGAVLRDGLVLAIAGPPNAGKSSLLNRLAGYDRAIVTEIPGTTRDVLREHLSIDGLPISIVDTAGLRHAADPVEAEGVRRTRAEVREADHVLWVEDVRTACADALAAARAEIGTADFTLVQNKVDLSGTAAGCIEHAGVTVARISALTGAGMDTLRAHLKAIAGYRSEPGGTFSARRRHLAALTRAETHLASAAEGFAAAAGLELVAEELRAAQHALSELTGELTSDDLLGEIFSRFCIGK
jgi:tRNA modification GTPase